MKSTLARLKNLKFKGMKFSWVTQSVDEYIAYVQKNHPELARKLDKMPFAKLHGSPHATPKTNDPWHASVALRRKEDFKGSGLSLHVYPDGTVVPSKEDYPVVTTTAATVEALGEENARWLDPQFIADWRASNQAASSLVGDTKGKGKTKVESSKGSLSNQHKSSGKYGTSSGGRSSGSTGQGGTADFDGYIRDPNSGALYRFAENGAVVYLDPDSQREYYYNEQGQTVWL